MARHPPVLVKQSKHAARIPEIALKQPAGIQPQRSTSEYIETRPMKPANAFLQLSALTFFGVVTGFSLLIGTVMLSHWDGVLHYLFGA